MYSFLVLFVFAICVFGYTGVYFNTIDIEMHFFTSTGKSKQVQCRTQIREPLKAQLRLPRRLFNNPSKKRFRRVPFVDEHLRHWKGCKPTRQIVALKTTMDNLMILLFSLKFENVNSVLFRSSDFL